MWRAADLAIPTAAVAREPVIATCDDTQFGFITSSSPAEPNSGGCGDDNDDNDDVNQAASYDDTNQGTASNCSNKSSYEVHHPQDSSSWCLLECCCRVEFIRCRALGRDKHGMQDDFNPCEEPDADGCGWEDTEPVVDTAFLDVSMLCSPSTGRPR